MGAMESDDGVVNQTPVAVASASPESGSTPPAVQFSSDGSKDPDGSISSYQGDFGDGNGSQLENPSHTYQNAGNFNAILTMIDNEGAT